MVISDEQMKVYLNDKLVLWIPELLGPTAGGALALEGNGLYSNFTIEDDNIEDLPNTKGS